MDQYDKEESEKRKRAGPSFDSEVHVVKVVHPAGGEQSRRQSDRINILVKKFKAGVRDGTISLEEAEAFVGISDGK
jgi:hypothetical protein